jgi:hypothetical protein
MSVHAWVRKNLAAYVAGGLTAASRGRLERHVSGCAECEGALAEVRSVDHKLTALFADVRPGPALEEEAIRRLRQVPALPRQRRLSRKVRAVLAVAAGVLLAVAGAGLSALMEEDGVRFPGQDTSSSPDRVLVGRFLHSTDDSVSMRSDTGEIRLGGKTERSYYGILRGQRTSEMNALEDLEKKRKNSIGFYAPSLALSVRGTSRVHTNPFDGLTNGKTDHGMNFLDGTSNSFAFTPPPMSGIPSGEMAGTLRGRSKEAFSPDGSKVVTGRVEDGFRRWDTLTGERLPPTPPKYFKPGEAFAQLGPKGESQAGEKKPARVPAEVKEEGGRSQQQGKKGGEKADPSGKEKAPAPGVDGKAPGAKKPEVPEQGQPPAGRKIIRSGEVEFEVESFDTAVAIVTRLVNATKGGFVATINSDKLANGKMCGSIVVRVPPDQLDALVLGLRKELGKTGELKGQRIGSQDITKQYTDLESRLRAARTMEERLLKIIRDGKGEIKDLLLAEKELGVWRTRVEELEGELRYYASQVALSTLKVLLTEKNIRSAAAVSERERVQAGVEVEDVETAMRELLAAVDEAHGRVTRSEMKQHGAGQFNALLHFEVAPDKAGPVRDRLRQLGTVARLEIDRVQQAEGGTLPRDGRLRRGDTQFLVSLYNLANVNPRETVTLKLAAPDVAAAYRALRGAVAKAKGRVANAQLNEQDKQNVTAQLDFNIRRADESALLAALGEAGELLARNVTRAAEGENVTDAKLLFKVELLPAAAIPARETVILAVEVPDVEATLAVLAAQVKESGGTVLAKGENQESNGRVTARVIYRVPLVRVAGVVAKVKSAGQVRVSRLVPDPKAPEGKLAVGELDVTLSNGELLVPSEQGLWAQVRSGLAVSLRGLSLSASWLIVGLLFVLPWLLLIYAALWLVRRLWRGGSSPAPATAAPVSGGTTATGP